MINPISLGDYKAGEVLNFHFTTFAADDTPTALAGGATVAVYKNDVTVESVAGVTLNGGWDSRVGLNQVNIDTLADAAFYSSGSDFSVVMTGGTVAGVSAAGFVVARFTLGRNRLSPAGLDSVEVESGLNARQALSLLAAALAGNITAVDGGGGLWTFTIKGAGVSTIRISSVASSATKARTNTLSPPA